jgi:hypothetical protein
MNPDDQECSFHPHINPLSSSILIKSLKQTDQKPKWESLYSLQSKRKEILELKRKQIEIQKIEEEAKLTFRPQLVSDYEFKEQRISVVDRAQLYNNNEIKKEAVQKQKDEQIKKDMQECTFKPKINRPKMPKRTNGDLKKNEGYSKIHDQSKCIRTFLQALHSNSPVFPVVF